MFSRGALLCLGMSKKREALDYGKHSSGKQRKPKPYYVGWHRPEVIEAWKDFGGTPTHDQGAYLSAREDTYTWR